MIKTFCDRCGKEVDFKKINAVSGATKAAITSFITLPGRYKDMCLECMVLLEEWLQGEKPINNKPNNDK